MTRREAAALWVEKAGRDIKSVSPASPHLQTLRDVWRALTDGTGDDRALERNLRRLAKRVGGPDGTVLKLAADCLGSGPAWVIVRFPAVDAQDG